MFYAVVSYLLISTVIVPGPFIVVLISYRHFKVSYITLVDMHMYIKSKIFQRTAPFKDVATKGIKQKFWWWSSYDLLRRLAFMIIVILEGQLSEYQQVRISTHICMIDNYVFLLTL